MFPLRLCGGKPLVAVTRERRYGPSRLRVDDDDVKPLPGTTMWRENGNEREYGAEAERNGRRWEPKRHSSLCVAAAVVTVQQDADISDDKLH